MEFFQTRMGQQFFESTMPRLTRALEQLAERFGVDVQEAQSAEKREEFEFWEKAFLHALPMGGHDPKNAAQIADAALEQWKAKRKQLRG